MNDKCKKGSHVAALFYLQRPAGLFAGAGIIER